MTRSIRRGNATHAVAWLIAFAANGGIACSAHAQASMAPDSRYDLLVAAADSVIEQPEAEQIAKVEASYWSLFPREPLEGKSVPELTERLRAARTGVFYTHSADIADQGLEALRALEARHSASPQLVAQAFTALMSASELDRAEALAHAHPDAGLARLPERHTDASFVDTAPSEWVLSADGSSMTRRAVPMDEGLTIIVVSHPQCHFSQRAIEAIGKDPALAATFAEHGHWITPRLREQDFEVIPEWNREHPGFAMTSVYDPNRWKGFDFRETPVFYFLVDGQIRQVIRGWPGDGQLASLKQAVAALAPQATRAQAAASTRK
jgi:hypothetical protein